MRISVREPDRKPKSDATAEKRAARRKVISDKRKLRDEMAATPRYVRAGRIQVQLRPAPTLLRECGSCGHENWKWLEECARCHAPLA